MGNPEELWSAFKATILDVASGCDRTHDEAKRTFVSQEALNIIDQSFRARLNGRAELLWELRRKTIRVLKVGQGGLCGRNV